MEEEKNIAPEVGACGEVVPSAEWEPDFGEDGVLELVDDEMGRSLIEWMNRKYFIIKTGSKVRVGVEEDDPEKGCRDFSLMKKADFMDYFANLKVVAAGKTLTLGVFWFRHLRRRQYRGLKFSPGESFDGFYNLWCGFAYEPTQGDCSLYLDHVLNVIAGGSERIANYILDWMAHAVQNPGELAGTAIVLRGKQGTGKGIFCNTFGELFGAHYTHISQPSHLTGRFNSHLKRCIVLFCDEAHWGADKKGEGVLKALVTEPTLQIEGKGQDVIEIKNHGSVRQAGVNS